MVISYLNNQFFEILISAILLPPISTFSESFLGVQTPSLNRVVDCIRSSSVINNFLDDKAEIKGPKQEDFN